MLCAAVVHSCFVVSDSLIPVIIDCGFFILIANAHLGGFWLLQKVHLRLYGVVVNAPFKFFLSDIYAVYAEFFLEGCTISVAAMSSLEEKWVEEQC